MSLKYRSDIDGLRTLAVMPVIFYHAGMTLFSGGYVGVDIFFVISGYLITSIIVKELDAGNFTISNFYVRRVKRIFPALYFLLAFTFILSFFSLMPSHFESFGKSIVSTVLFSSNILFWRESGYFDTQAETKPLLHTWSLGVEEQFYIFFPVMLMLIARYGSKKYVRYALALFIASFILCIWGTKTHPEAAFYLIPFRTWELMLGALIALKFFPRTEKPLYTNIMSIAGIALLSISIFTFETDTPFPGYAALLPCVGTALIIMSQGSVINNILSLRPVVWVGLLSYSLYLWHWPLFALRNYWESIHIPEFWKSDAFLIFLTFAFASFSYYIVEKPLRVKKIENKKVFFRATYAVMALGCILGGYVALHKGLPDRIPPQAAAYAKTEKSAFETPECFSKDASKLTLNGLCIMGDKTKAPSFILWGDSHALVLADGFDAYGKEKGISGILAAKAACAPLQGVTRTTKPATFRCIEYNDRVLELIQQSPVKNVLINARWQDASVGSAPHFFIKDGETVKSSPEENPKVFERGLERTMQKLAGKNVYFVMDSPDFPYDIPRELAKLTVLQKYLPSLAEDSNVGIKKDEYEESNEKVREIVANLSEHYKFSIIELADGLCPEGECIGEKDGKALYMDDNHLSRAGSVEAVRGIGTLISKMASQ
ncbi:acyltransferase family protein [Seleniivibrio woodruffii]|uniref:Peptidoglycan/LPS O-acetylase OafA/YrhL n=1 Tax=Seleniivibrio woodruffii TaxID=1078050 RepID=A0A4R1KBW9_9BACT|nr:acyltransferase family protein [Seleniivibrio woodruffii]TCK62026.1 peptidoglycan/LPS O-acetylase OafA/YrhL [Seleniivibrio woodruffii]TVZ34857.1 peptidoglycan/LPS O-acetylase OafA/YrhL [Seleniivibrio woodruffii]